MTLSAVRGLNMIEKMSRGRLKHEYSSEIALLAGHPHVESPMEEFGTKINQNGPDYPWRR